MNMAGGGSQPGAGGTPPTPPNNWRAALAALASPPTPPVVGAPVPAGGGFGQPSGGVNAAFLASLGGGGPGATGGTPITPGGTAIGNPGFLGALAAIQGRRQQGY
jgi:hypothetical protein